MKTNLILINNDIVDAEDLLTGVISSGTACMKLSPSIMERPCMRKCIWKTC